LFLFLVLSIFVPVNKSIFNTLFEGFFKLPFPFLLKNSLLLWLCQPSGKKNPGLPAQEYYGVHYTFCFCPMLLWPLKAGKVFSLSLFAHPAETRNFLWLFSRSVVGILKKSLGAKLKKGTLVGT